jgi:hypothetical protein
LLYLLTKKLGQRFGLEHRALHHERVQVLLKIDATLLDERLFHVAKHLLGRQRRSDFELVRGTGGG